MPPVRQTWPLGLLVVVLAVLLPRGWPLSPGSAVATPWQLTELVLPGLLDEEGKPVSRLFSAPPPPAGASLPAAALPAPPRGPTSGRLYPGLVPMLLGLFALATATGWAAWTLRACLAWGLLGSWITALPDGSAAVLIGGLLGLAGLGAARLTCPAPPRSAAPDLALGVGAVLLAAGLGGLAIWAGAAADHVALEPLLGRLAPEARAGWAPEALAVNAAHLRAVLDRSALAAFAAMTALLLHLKGRRRLTGWLLVAVAGADLLSLNVTLG